MGNLALDSQLDFSQSTVDILDIINSYFSLDSLKLFE